MADVYIGKNPNDGTNSHGYTEKELLQTTQGNALKRPNRFWAKKLASIGRL